MTASRIQRERARILQSEARLRRELLEVQAKRRALTPKVPSDRASSVVDALVALDAEIAARATGLGMTESQAWREFDRRMALAKSAG